MATTAGIPNIVTFSICFARFAQPIRTASGLSSRSAGSSGFPATILPTPPFIFSARTVATTTAASGVRPDARHLISKNFSAPMSAPKPASVQTISFVARAIRSAMIELLPWAMLANGPAWTKAGPPSSVWRRFGFSASRSSTAIAPATPRSSAVTGCPVGPRREHHPSEPRPEILEIRREGEDGHHLRGDRDHEIRLPRDAVLAATEPDDDVAQRPVADVEDARPQDAVRVDAERVLVVEAVVDEGAGQVVGRTDRVHVTGQMEVEILHRDHLAVATAGRATFDPEHGAERGLADADSGLVADRVETLRQPDRRRRLALAEGRR